MLLVDRDSNYHGHTNRGLRESTDDGVMSNRLWTDLEVTRLETREVRSDEAMNCRCCEWWDYELNKLGLSRENEEKDEDQGVCKIYVSMELITPRCRLRSSNRRIPFWWRIGRRWLSDTSEPHTHLTISKWLSTHSLSLSLKLALRLHLLIAHKVYNINTHFGQTL